jgi:hypothetical protein
MTINANEITKDLIAYAMVYDKQSLKNLLKRNGISVPVNFTDKEIIMATLLASSKSPVFKNELSEYLSKTGQKLQKDYNSFVGGQFDIGTQADNMMFTAEKDFYNQIGNLNPQTIAGINAAAKAAQLPSKPVSTKAPKEKGKFFQWFSANVLTPDNINAGIQLGLTSLNSKIQKKNNDVIYETSDITQRQNELLALQSQKPKASFNVTTIAIVLVSVAIVGGVVYYITKKK